MSSRLMPSSKALVAVAVLGVVVSGCSKAPTAEIQSADDAFQLAMVAGAEEYAPEALSQVQDLRSQLDAELALQAEKWAVTRSYDRALELANQVKTASDQAATDAASAKEVARQETQALLAEVRVALEEVQTMLANAPTGKGTAADLLALRTDLDSATMILGESEAAFQQGRFLEAKSKVLSVKAGAESVRAAIDAALQARSARRGATS